MQEILGKRESISDAYRSQHHLCFWELKCSEKKGFGRRGGICTFLVCCELAAYPWKSHCPGPFSLFVQRMCDL